MYSFFSTATSVNETYIRLTKTNGGIVQIPVSNIGVMDAGEQGGTYIFYRHYNSSTFVTQSPDEIVDIICEVKTKNNKKEITNGSSA